VIYASRTPGGNTVEGEPHVASALSTTASAAVARMRSGSGSGWASSDHGQNASANLASARSQTVSVWTTSRTAIRSMRAGWSSRPWYKWRFQARAATMIADGQYGIERLLCFHITAISS
jgi:hypothetical protein